VIFMGTPDFSVPALSEIVAAGHQVVAVYSQPPRPAGRGMSEKPSPVHRFAEQAGLPVFTPRSLRSADAQDRFRAHGADVAVVVAYGLILPKPILGAPTHGCLNLHASALPRWRGAAPIQRAIMAGDTEAAAMVMQMDEGLDTGPVCLAQQVPIGPNTTAGELHDRLAVEGADLLVRALAALSRGSLTATPQAEDGVTYAAKIDKAEARIDFARPAAEVHNLIRGLSPFPGAWFTREVGGGKPAERIKVLRSELASGDGAPGTVLEGPGLTIACGDGAVRLVQVQRAGKKPVDADAFLRGANIATGSHLG
jgi:methionyl-tRNA formyltransferase